MLLKNAMLAMSVTFLATGCVIGPPKNESPLSAKELVATINTAVSLVCGTIDERNRGLPAEHRIDLQDASLSLKTAAASTRSAEASLFVVSGSVSSKQEGGDLLEISLARNPIPKSVAQSAYAPNSAQGSSYYVLSPTQTCAASNKTAAEHLGCLVLSGIESVQQAGSEAPANTAPLRLKGLTVALNFAVTQSKTGTIGLEFDPVKVGVSRSNERQSGHQIKLVFGPDATNQSVSTK